jgi:adenine-specific DNA-methyltransferase
MGHAEMTAKNRLELSWIGKESRPRLEPRIMIEDESFSHHASARREGDHFDNLLIKGDNLLALKALEQDFTGQIKCIYIDPPYNTGNAFEHYDDALEHSVWLSLMKERIEILKRLLRPDGFFCVHIDDSEGHYLKVMLDEVFGRSNYLTTLYIQVRYAQKTLKQDMDFHKQVEMVHIYRKEFGAKPNLPVRASTDEKFCYYVDEKGSGSEIELGGKRVVLFTSDDYEIRKGEPSQDGLKEIWATGSILDGNSSGRFFRDYLAGRAEKDGLGSLYKVYGIGDDKFPHRYFTGPKRAGATKGKYFQGIPLGKLESGSVSTSPIENFYDLAGSFGNCRHEGGVEFRSGKKPEALLDIILKRFTSEGDWVLDSFAGSGTTGAVAHKLRRRWIMVELGEHCESHVVPRMKGIVEGADKTGVSVAAGWKGGGGFRYFRLGPSLLEQDQFGNWVISKAYNAEMLSEAMCKHFGFSYLPSADHYWMQGKSSETDFIYVTTASLTHDQIRTISDEVGDERTLLICCKAFQSQKVDGFKNITVRKIPASVLDRCEWGKDDYSLKIENLPMMYDEDDDGEPQSELFRSEDEQ